MTGYQRDPFFDWECGQSQDLVRFVTGDVPALKAVPWPPYSRRGLQIAELAAHDLFRDGPDSDPVLARRWNRFVGHAMILELNVGQWINAPAEAPGVRNSQGLMPVVWLPDGVVILPLLETVLAVPPDDPRRGAILIDVVDEERAELEQWLTSGQPRPEVDQVRWRAPLDLQ